MDFIKDPKRASLKWTKNLKETFWDLRPWPLFAISQTILLNFFSFLKANIWRGLRCHIIFFVSVHRLPWGLPKVAKEFVWQLKPLKIFELENNSPGSFMHFQAMTFRKLQICRKSWSAFLKALTTGYSKSIDWTFGVVLCYRNCSLQKSQSCSFHA